MTTFFGWIIALSWGCEFAFISFEQVWVTTPCIQVCGIYMRCFQTLFGTCISCVLAPICETSGLFFSKINITKNWDSCGLFRN
jgi:caveolin 3